MAAPVQFDSVWKKFRKGERHDSLRDLIPSLLRRAPKPTADARDFWALENVSFEVHPGRALGIVGPNGAGKSTTLKLLTRILRPTAGRCEVRGRVGALIEVAAGFHPDLTGRENVFLQGAILGMRQHEVAARFDEIVDFAGVGAFIDTPVKRYSSGMHARLGFAIAVHLEPDVLIIDEVLSVGDMAFQQRCIARMHDFKRRGVAIVFVSHNLSAVRDLCDHAIHLHRSTQAAGPTGEVLEHYVRSQATTATMPASDVAAIRSVRLLDANGAETDRTTPGAALTLQVDYDLTATPSGLTFGVLLRRSTDGLVVYDGHFTPDEMGIRLIEPSAGRGPVRVRVAYRLAAHVTRGFYHFECFVFHVGQYLHRVAPAAHMSVDESRTWGGIADLAVRPVVCEAEALVG